MKFDVDTRQMLEWKEDNCWPSELVFVPSPNAIEEDDGERIKTLSVYSLW